MFNKGAIYNIGFNESLQYDDYDCYVFHDVDLLSETDTNYYGCPNSPMHLSVGIDKFDYKYVRILYNILLQLKPTRRCDYFSFWETGRTCPQFSPVLIF